MKPIDVNREMRNQFKIQLLNNGVKHGKNYFLRSKEKTTRKSTAASWKEIRLRKISLLERKTCDISFL